MDVDLQEALEHARLGAEIASEIMLRHYRGDYEVFNKEGAANRAGAVLTEPDILCDRALQNHFASRYPDHAVVSEESTDSLSTDWFEREWIWYIDPIDGSLSYLEGTDNFGVSIGLCRDGVPLLGVLRNPARDLEAWACAGCGAYVNSEPVGFSRPSLHPARLILSSNQCGRKSYRRAIEILKPSEVVTLESVVTKTIFLLQGRGDYYFSLPYEVFHGGCPSAWDLAASAAIVAEAGGVSTDIYGEPFFFNRSDTDWPRGHLFSHTDTAPTVLKFLGDLIDKRREEDEK